MNINKSMPVKDQCKATLLKIDTKAVDFQLGHTKVFLRERLETVLERSRHNTLKRVVAKIAAVILGYIQRTRYLAIRRKIIKIQAWFVILDVPFVSSGIYAWCLLLGTVESISAKCTCWKSAQQLFFNVHIDHCAHDVPWQPSKSNAASKSSVVARKSVVVKKPERLN